MEAERKIRHLNIPSQRRTSTKSAYNVYLPVTAGGIGSRYSANGDWQNEIQDALKITTPLKPFGLRCNYIRNQGRPLYYNDETGCDNLFRTLLELHTLFRLGLAQKQASLSRTEAKSLMIAKLAQVSHE